MRFGEAVKSFLAYTLQRRGTDDVDLDMPAPLTPAVPVEDTVDAIAAMVQAGQPEGVVQLPVGQQAGIGSDAAGLDLPHQATTEIDPQGGIIRFTLWVVHRAVTESASTD